MGESGPEEIQPEERASDLPQTDDDVGTRPEVAGVVDSTIALTACEIRASAGADLFPKSYRNPQDPRTPVDNLTLEECQNLREDRNPGA